MNATPSDREEQQDESSVSPRIVTRFLHVLLAALPVRRRDEQEYANSGSR